MIVLIRGGGDIASGVALRLWRSGWNVMITELDQPQVVRRTVSFAEAVFQGETDVEGVHALRVDNHLNIGEHLHHKVIPVIVDPMGQCIREILPGVVIDARMLKKRPEEQFPQVPLTIGLGPGFTAGENCTAVIETIRGPFLGRVYWHGCAQEDTGVPEPVEGHQTGRVLRAPVAGRFGTIACIGSFVEEGEPIARIDSQMIHAPFRGLLRGLLHAGLQVKAGMKVGDIDPRLDMRLCQMVSDKALAVGGGVLEVLLAAGLCPERKDAA